MQELGDVMERDTLEGSFCGAMIEWCAAVVEGGRRARRAAVVEAEARCFCVCRMCVVLCSHIAV